MSASPPPPEHRRPLLVFLSDALECPPRLGYQIHLLALAEACARLVPTRVLAWVGPGRAGPGGAAAAPDVPPHVHALTKPDERPITKATKLRYLRWAVSWLEESAPPGSWVWVRGYSTAMLLGRDLERLRGRPWGLRFVYDAASILRLEPHPGPGALPAAVRGWIEARNWRRFDRLRTLSEPMREHLVATGVAAARVAVIPVGCERRACTWQPAPGRKRLLYVGSAEAWQGVPQLLAAMRRLAESEPSCELTLLGTAASDPGVPPAGPNVRFLGRRPHDEALAAYLEHDLCVVPRTPSAVTRAVLPMKVPEAMASGIPILATDLPAIRGATGADGAFLLAGNSPEEIERGVRRALADPERLAAVGAAALARAGELYWDRLAERVRDWLADADALPERAGGLPAAAGPAPAVWFARIEPTMPGGIYSAERPFEEACARLGARVRVLPFGRRAVDESLASRVRVRLADLAAFAREARRERPDIVHLNSAFDRRALVRDAGYAAVARLAGQPIFLKLHGSDRELARRPGPLWGPVSRFVLGGAAAVGVLSSEEKRALVEGGHDAARIHVVKNAVDGARFAGAGDGRRDPGRLLFLARFVPAKGGLEVLRAVRLLADRGLRVTAELVGDGPQRGELEAEARRLGIEDRVRFAGFVPEAETVHFYRDAGLLVLPTYHGEGFSMTLFQAVAAGLAIVTTRVGAAADYLRDPDHCLWVEPRDPEGLAARIQRLLDEPALARAMGENNLRLAPRFAPEAVAGEYLALYRACGRGARAERR